MVNRPMSQRATLGKKAASLLRSPLSHFVLAGITFFVIRGLWLATPDRLMIEIRRSEIAETLSGFEAQVGRKASPEEKRALENQIVEKMLWLAQAKALGLHRSDPVVRQRLLQNMRFLESGPTKGNDDVLLEWAYELEMESSDPLVQRRLIDRVKALLGAGVRSEMPSESELRTFYRKNTMRWTEPPRLDFSHVFFSRDKRRERTVDDADTVFQLLRDELSFSESATRRGDPFLSGHQLRNASPTQIVARLGPALDAGIRNAPIMQWIGPVESTFGFHLVWIHRRIDTGVLPYDEVRLRVLEEWYEEEIRLTLQRELTRHRAEVEIRILDDLGEGTSASERRDQDIPLSAGMTEHGSSTTN
jgi:hypothetical protein